jgi:hypothetical protein
MAGEALKSKRKGTSIRYTRSKDITRYKGTWGNSGAIYEECERWITVCR